jgi:hypothetical protein
MITPSAGQPPSDRVVERAQARWEVLVLAAPVVAETAQQDAERSKAVSDAPEPPAEFPEGYPGGSNIFESELSECSSLAQLSGLHSCSSRQALGLA